MALESISPKEAELVVNAFKWLTSNRSTSILNFWDHDYQRHEGEWKRAHNQTELERAFHQLTLLGFAKENSPHYYSVLDPNATPDMVMRRLLQHLYNETKTKLRTFEILDAYVAPVLLLSTIAAAFVFLLSTPTLSTIYSQLAAGCFILLFFGWFAVVSWSSEYWQRQKLSNEKMIAVKLTDSYDALTKAEKDGKARTIRLIREATRLLRATRRTRWNAINQERAKLSKIGEDIHACVIPAMSDPKREKRLAEVLVRLACLFFDGTPESVDRIPSVYESMLVAGTAPASVAKSTLRLGGSTIGSLVKSGVVGLALPLVVFEIVAWILNRPLFDFLEYIGTSFIVVFIGVYYGSQRSSSR